MIIAHPHKSSVPCLQEMKQPEQANSSFSTSLTLCAQLPQGWLSWACFCTTQFNETKDPSWLESAVTAYLQVLPSLLCFIDMFTAWASQLSHFWNSNTMQGQVAIDNSI